ncbi:MAG: hypothetical protein RIT04_522 [Candidatus Parcubacteria bacterium]|jgi:uncharacterized membrane protein (UPF0127 family)
MKFSLPQSIGTVILVAIITFLLVQYTQKSSKKEVGIIEPLSYVLVADTNSEKELGLGGRDSLASDTGMLFVFDESSEHAFWMKDMKFGIDIIWLDENMRVVHVENDVLPESYPKIFSSREKSRFVLEVSAGIAKKNNYTEGSTLDFLKAHIYTK